MLFERILYFGADFRFHTGDVEVDAGRIAAVRPRGCTPRAMLLPGLVDIHLHGNSGADFSDGAEDGLLRMARFLAAHGTTSFSPASLTLPEEPAQSGVPHGGKAPCGTAGGRCRFARNHNGRPLFQHG